MTYFPPLGNDNLLRDQDVRWLNEQHSNIYHYITTLYYTADSSFVKADYPDLKAIRVKVQGGGGGGGGRRPSENGGGGPASGGGGGGYAEAFILVSDLDVTEAIVVGAGGVGVSQSNGTAGGTSSFDTISGIVQATGGGGGLVNAGADATLNGGAGGVGSGGDFHVDGQNGGDTRVPSGLNLTYAQAGAGGDSFLGHGGSRPAFAQTGQTYPGVEYGGGGTGILGSATQTGTGGDGADGIVIVELYA